MARSYKKTPITGICCGRKYQKQFKKQENSRERKHIKQMLKEEKFDTLPHTKAFGNEWTSPRDGKTWFGNLKFRDDVEWKEYYKELMRK